MRTRLGCLRRELVVGGHSQRYPRKLRAALSWQRADYLQRIANDSVFMGVGFQLLGRVGVLMGMAVLVRVFMRMHHPANAPWS